MEAGQNSTAWHAMTLHTANEVTCCVNRLIDALEPHGYGERELFGVRLALEEAIVNAVKHGNRNDSSKAVRVRYQTTEQQFLVEVQDEGPGFDPEGVPDPLAPENLERPGGRGVFLMRHYMTWVSFNERGNCVTMCRRRSP
jgi:serine/threonine-protein kinase RsbW